MAFRVLLPRRPPAAIAPISWRAEPCYKAGNWEIDFPTGRCGDRACTRAAGSRPSQNGETHTMAAIVRHWAESIAASGLSKWLSNQYWIIPTSQSLHIVMLAVAFASAAMLNLRLIGVGRGGRPMSALVATHVPWIWGALLVLLFTGIVQTITEPVRQFVTPAFWWKMAMIIVVVLVTRSIAAAVRRDPARWDAPARPASIRLLAATSLALWVAIVCCGRFIGYTWEFHV
jgi:hypothetical protein